LKYKLNPNPYIGAGLLAAMLWLFKNPAYKLLEVILVKPVFASFEAGVWTDVVVVAVLGFLTVWLARDRTWKSLSRIVLIAVVFYVFQRIDAHWTFTKMSSLPQIAYWDLVPAFLLLSLPLCLLLQGKTLQEVNALPGQGFVEDNAVNNYEDDHFKRKIAASEIARLIELTNNRKSFAIGILGDYGSGKTSFQNLINLGLADDRVLKISFDPWSAGSPETIRREFFDLLAVRIAAVDLKISSMVYSYGRKLASFDSRSLSWLNWLGFLRNHGSVQSSGEYDQINKMLRATGHKIIITIDDLDRLYPAEIMEVLKLIRNTADFSNVFYLVGYDKAYVQSVMRNLTEAGGMNYLDKIFQLEIPLPKREENDLLVTLQGYLKEMVTKEHFDIFENSMIPHGFRNRYEKAYSGILRQGRDVVRFLNGFKIVYKLIGEEVDFECLLLLELIKFRFPAIYDLIYTQSETFLYEKPVRSTHEQYLCPRLAKQKDFNNRTDEVSVFRTYLEKLELTDEEVSLLDGIFKALFKGSQYHRPESKNSISYPLYFEIYFRYRLSLTDLSDKDFKAAMVSGHMREYMEYCASHNLHKELMVRLMQEDISQSRRHFEQVIRWIFSFGRTYVEKENTRYFDCEPLIDKIYNYHNVITDNLYKKDVKAYQDFIDHLFSISEPPFLFENELIYHLKKKGDDFVIPTAKLTAHQYSYFTRYAESSHGLSADVLWVFWGAKEHYRVPADSPSSYYEKWRFEGSLVAKMKSYLKTKDPVEFLKFSIQREMREPSLAFIYPQVLEMFGDPAEYRQLVVDNPALDEKVRQEYLELYGKCAALEFKQYVEMDFQTALRKPEPA
jgi:hypothetical protein